MKGQAVTPDHTPTPPFYDAYTLYREVFTPAELDAFIAHADAAAAGRSPVQLPPSPQLSFAYDSFGAVARAANTEIYRFDVTGFGGPIHYVVERAAPDGGSGWHMDDPVPPLHPKLCFVALLSDPDEYQGGDLEIHGRPKVKAAPRERGSIIAFPFYTLRRFTPVTSGVRRLAMIWAVGPRIR